MFFFFFLILIVLLFLSSQLVILVLFLEEWWWIFTLQLEILVRNSFIRHRLSFTSGFILVRLVSCWFFCNVNSRFFFLFPGAQTTASFKNGCCLPTQWIPTVEQRWALFSENNFSLERKRSCPGLEMCRVTGTGTRTLVFWAMNLLEGQNLFCQRRNGSNKISLPLNLDLAPSYCQYLMWCPDRRCAYLRQDPPPPPRAILVIFGHRALIFFCLLESSSKKRKNDTSFVRMCSGDHLGDAKIPKKGTSLRRI